MKKKSKENRRGYHTPHMAEMEVVGGGGGHCRVLACVSVVIGYVKCI